LPAFILNAARALDDRFLPERDIHPGKPVFPCEKDRNRSEWFYLSVRAAFSGGGRDKRASTQTAPGGG